MKNFNCNASDWVLALEEIQSKSGYHFQDLERLRLALTHSSYASEAPEPFCQWNERLEFLGDAVLELAISQRLYREMPQEQEGGLTRARSVLVDEPANARNARTLGLDQALLLGKSECQSGGRHRNSLLGDAFEAFLGAVYLDGGFPEAQAIVDRLYPDILEAVRTAEVSDNPKGFLQQKCQALYQQSPQYQNHSATGPSHAPHFLCQVVLPDGSTYPGEGDSKKLAEQAAAKNALSALTLSELPQEEDTKSQE